MCNPLTVLAAGTTMQVSGQLQAGRAAQRNANAEAANMEYQAAVEQDNALAEAGMIRRVGEKARGQTITASAASGVKVGQGSALDAEREVMTNTETDAYMAILNGDRSATALRTGASNARQSGRDAKAASKIGAFTSLLSAGSQGLRASGFRSAGPGYAGTQAPAPVETRYIPRG